MPPVRQLLTPDSANPRVATSLGTVNVSVALLHLAPAGLARRGTVCKHSVPACVAGCYNTAGRAGIGAGTVGEIATGKRTNTIQAARIARTHWFYDDRDGFVARLLTELHAHVRRAERLGRRPAVRLNATSDIPWETVAPELFTALPDIQFYDYTKYPFVARSALLPANYHLTQSYAGEAGGPWPDAERTLRHGRNLAVVFDTRLGHPLPTVWRGWPVLDGDLHDARFLDPVGYIVGLRARGRLRGVAGTASGFVQRAAPAALTPSLANAA